MTCYSSRLLNASKPTPFTEIFVKPGDCALGFSDDCPSEDRVRSYFVILDIYEIHVEVIFPLFKSRESTLWQRWAAHPPQLWTKFNLD